MYFLQQLNNDEKVVVMVEGTVPYYYELLARHFPPTSYQYLCFINFNLCICELPLIYPQFYVTRTTKPPPTQEERKKAIILSSNHFPPNFLPVLRSPLFAFFIISLP